jgi:hypothetical protein
MDSDSRHIYVAFHERAGGIVSQTLAAFENVIKNVSRRREEYRFVQLRDQYTNTLKQQLEDAAARFVQTNQHNLQLDELQHGLQQIIKDYLHRFIMKSRTM